MNCVPKACWSLCEDDAAVDLKEKDVSGELCRAFYDIGRSFVRDQVGLPSTLPSQQTYQLRLSGHCNHGVSTSGHRHNLAVEIELTVITIRPC